MTESNEIMKIELSSDYCVSIVEEDDGQHVYYNCKEYQIGQFEPIEQKIYIYSNMANGLKWRTLAHELAHAFLFVVGLQNSQMNEESICDFISIYHEKITEIVNEYKEMAGKYYANKNRDKAIHR